MRTVKIFVSFAVAFLPIAASNAQNFDAPKFDVGDKWTYSYRNLAGGNYAYTYTNQVFKVDADSGWMYGETQQSNPTRKSYVLRYDFKRGGVKEWFEFNNVSPSQPGNRYNDRTGLDDDIQYPLFIGKAYKISYPAVNGGSSLEYTVTVESLEKVSTAAGQFDAYKVKFDGYWANGKFSGAATKVSYVAPDVKRIVRTEYQDRVGSGTRVWNNWVEELVKWEPKATVPDLLR